jgi:MscS family membrane protein
VLLVSALVRSFTPPHLISADIASLFRAKTLLIVGAVWILFRIADSLAEQLQARILAKQGATGFHLVHLLRRIAKVTFVLVGLTFWLDNLGFKVSTIVASLGIIGLAVGLASQKFIEDLIAAMTLHATGVVKRNELIRFGDRNGVVEDIGLRTTSVRSRDRTLVTMPNATFAAMQIENFARRDKFLFQTRLGLRYETTPDQLRYVLIELRKLLYAHPKVIDEEARVRFIGFGASTLDVEIFCYIAETSIAEYLAVAEDLNLRIMDIVAGSGTGFAFPSQTLYFQRDQAPNPELVRQAEATVRHWREQGQLFLHKFPEEEIAKLKGTLKYPDSPASDEVPNQ